MNIQTNLNIDNPSDKRTIDMIHDTKWELEDIEIYNNETVYLTLKGHCNPNTTGKKDIGQL